MIEAFLYPLLFLVIYSVGLYFNQKRSWKLSLGFSKLLKRLHYFSFPFLILVCIVNFGMEQDLRGIWTSRIIVGLYFLSALLTYFLIDKSIFTKIEKGYFAFLAKLPVAGALFLLIPMLGYLILGAMLYHFATPYEQIYYSDEQIRVQTSFNTQANEQKIEVIKNDGLFQKTIHKEFIFTPTISHIEVRRESDSSRFEVRFEKNRVADEHLTDSVFAFALKIE